jgi:hypothetical protein
MEVISVPGTFQIVPSELVMVIAREVEESRSPQNIPVRPITSTSFPLPVRMMMNAIEES